MRQCLNTIHWSVQCDDGHAGVLHSQPEVVGGGVMVDIELVLYCIQRFLLRLVPYPVGDQ